MQSIMRKMSPNWKKSFVALIANVPKGNLCAKTTIAKWNAFQILIVNKANFASKDCKFTTFLNIFEYFDFSKICQICNFRCNGKELVLIKGKSPRNKNLRSDKNGEEYDYVETYDEEIYDYPEDEENDENSTENDENSTEKPEYLEDDPDDLSYEEEYYSEDVNSTIELPQKNSTVPDTTPMTDLLDEYNEVVDNATDKNPPVEDVIDVDVNGNVIEKNDSTTEKSETENDEEYYNYSEYYSYEDSHENHENDHESDQENDQENDDQESEKIDKTKFNPPEEDLMGQYVSPDECDPNENCQYVLKTYKESEDEIRFVIKVKDVDKTTFGYSNFQNPYMVRKVDFFKKDLSNLFTERFEYCHNGP